MGNLYDEIMMKKYSLIFPIAIVCLFISCKKEEQQQTTNTNTSSSNASTPVFIYDFNSSLADSSKNNIALDASGSINYVYVNDRNNVPNKAVTFNNGYVKLPTNNLYKVQFPFTVSFWTNVNDSASSNNRFIYSDANNNYYGFFIQTHPTYIGRLAFNFGDGVSPTASHRNSAISSVVLTSKRWHHVVAIYKGANDFDIYIDNIKDNGVTYDGGATTINHTTGAGLIGAYPGGSSFLNGKIDNIKFWNRTISAQEIQNEYNSNK